MPFSDVVISNQLTGKTGRWRVEENHLNPLAPPWIRRRRGGSRVWAGVTARVNTQEPVGGSCKLEERGWRGSVEEGVTLSDQLSFNVNCAEC